MARPRVALTDRFWPKVDRSAGLFSCWLWLASCTPEGYGRIGAGGAGASHLLAHRYAYELLVGPIPEGLELDHLCRTRSCVNPAHLEPVTGWVNTLRGIGPTAINAARTECARGHALDGTNTYQRPTGGRGCRICRRQASARYRERIAA